MEINYLTLPYPIGGQKKILDEDTFRRLYLQTDDTQTQVAEKYKISLKCIISSVKYYKQIIPNELKEKASRSYSNSAYKREPGLHKRNSVKLDKEKLVSLLSEGKTEWAIAEELGVAAQTVRKNIKSYGLPRPSKRIFSLSDDEWLDLEWANQIAPGLMESAYRGIDNPLKFFTLLYDAFVGLCRILWTIQRVGSRYSYYTENKIIPRIHIGWRINKQEIILSEELRKHKIEHIREYLWAKELGRRFSADIYIPKANLLIEINGSVHSIGFVINHDKEKTKLIKELGYKRLEFTSEEIDKNIDFVIEKIKKEMK